MAIYRLDKNLILQFGEAQWSIQRILDSRYVQLEDLSTGRIRKERIAKLYNDIVSGDVRVAAGKTPSDQDPAADNQKIIFCPNYPY
jgi:putative transposase